MCYCTYTVIDIPGFYMVSYLLFQGFSLPWINTVNSTAWSSSWSHPSLIRPGSGWVATLGTELPSSVHTNYKEWLPRLKPHRPSFPIPASEVVKSWKFMVMFIDHLRIPTSIVVHSHTRASCWVFVWCYIIRVPGWLLKSLNLITAPGSVSHEPGSVTWRATRQLKKSMLSVGEIILKN